MKINSINKNSDVYSSSNYYEYNRKKSPQKLNFSAMKASQFDGLDYSCMRKFKAPIEKFNSLKDFYVWTQEKLNKFIFDKSLKGKSKETEEYRKTILKQWQEGLGEYSTSIALLSMGSLIKNLKPDNDNVPPLFNNSIFEETVADVEGAVALDREFQFEITKLYKKHLKEAIIAKTKLGVQDGWVEIPVAKTPKQAQKNTELLNILSRKTWCTKGVVSNIYVKQFGFRIYIENGEPEICIRTLDNSVYEIQGRLNDSVIPDKYKDLVIDYIEKNNLDIDCDTEAALYDMD